MYVRRPQYSRLKLLNGEVDNKNGFQCAVSYDSRIMMLCVSIEPFLYVPFSIKIDIGRKTFHFWSAPPPITPLTPPPPLKMAGIQTLNFLSAPSEKWKPKGLFFCRRLWRKNPNSRVVDEEWNVLESWNKYVLCLSLIINWLIHWFVSFVHSFTRSFFHSLIYSFVRFLFIFLFRDS